MLPFPSSHLLSVSWGTKGTHLRPIGSLMGTLKGPVDLPLSVSLDLPTSRHSALSIIVNILVAAILCVARTSDVNKFAQLMGYSKLLCNQLTIDVNVMENPLLLLTQSLNLMIS